MEIIVMDDLRFAIFYTTQLDYLISCVETGSYGESIPAFKAREYDNIGDLRKIKEKDRIFLRFANKILAGPFIITRPHEHFIIDDSTGYWYLVSVEKTLPEYRPIWLFDKPWCFFFDVTLASQVNYRPFNELPKHLRDLPATKF